MHNAIHIFKFQDAQEFLRCLMDLLHEELKEIVITTEHNSASVEETMEIETSQSDADFQTTGSIDKVDSEGLSKPVAEHHLEDAMLIHDDENASKDYQKEKSCTKMNRTNSIEDIEKEINTFFETTEFLNNQETVKVQIHSRYSGDFIITI